MVKELVSTGWRLALVGGLAVSLHGCMLDPAGLAITAAQVAYTPEEPEPIDMLPVFKDMYRNQDCPQLTRTDDLLRQAAQQPGDHSTIPPALEAIRQVKVEKGCPAVAVAAVTPAAAVQPAAPAPALAPAAPQPLAMAPVAPTTNAPAATNASRGWLGSALLDSSSLPRGLVSDLGLPDGHGVLVTGIAPGSAAAQAGLKVADVIQSVDGKVFDQTPQLIEYLGTHKPGEVVVLQVWRNRASLRINASLAATQAQFPPADAGVEIFCYISAMPTFPIEGGGSYWLTYPFALPGATRNDAYARGQVVGQQFKNYLISQGVNPKSVEVSVGICGSGYGTAANSLKVTQQARTGASFTAIGATSVTVYWQP